MSAEWMARQAAATAVLADFEAFRDAGVPSEDGRDLAWSYWADRLAGMLKLLLDAGLGPLEQVRAVLDVFDWETDDRQYALEQIDDILRSGQ
jgi:hypothetical protein